MLVKLLMNSLYGEQIRKNIEEIFACKSKAWMMSEYDEEVKEYWRISQSNYNLKRLMTKDWKMTVKNCIPYRYI